MNHRKPWPLRKRFGQHFLHDQSVILDILAALNPKPEDFLIEIGPGAGALTWPLLKKVEALTAIEVDLDLIHWWENQNLHRLTLIGEDVLSVDFSRFGGQPLRLVGNLPYNISTPLLFHLDAQKADIVDMHFMLQKEVVARLVAKPHSKSYGRLSVALQLDWDLETLIDVPPEAFTPPPAVDSAVIRLQKRQRSRCPDVNKKILEKVLAAAFGQRRKTLGKALQRLFNKSDFAEIRALGIPLDDRAENLFPEQFCQLAAYFAAKAPVEETPL